MTGDLKNDLPLTIAAQNRQHLESLKAMGSVLNSTAQAQQVLDSMSHLKGIQEALRNPAVNAVRQYQEILRGIDPGKAVRDVMAAMDATRGIREAMAAFQPGKAFQDAIASLNTSGVLRELIDARKLLIDFHPSTALFDVVRQVGEASKVFQDLSRGPLFEIARTMESFTTVQKHIQETIATHGRPFEELAKTLQAFSPNDWPAIYKLPRESIAVQADGTVIVDGTSVTLAEIQATVEQVLEKANARTDERLEQHLRLIVEEAKKIKQPLLQQIVFMVLLPLLVMVFAALLNPIADHYIKEYLTKDRRSLKKEINAEVSQVADRRSLSLFRMVTASTLYVRERPATKSAVVGTLLFGQAVLLMEKDDTDRSWALVRWTNEDGSVSIEGWVFARYLEKFK